MVNWPIVSRILGMMLIIFSLTNIIPIIISDIYHDHNLYIFTVTMIFQIAIGYILWYPFRECKAVLHPRDSFVITVFIWVLLGLLGAIPFLLLSYTHLSLINAIFESFSGLTTTGATVLHHLDTFPHSILYYRQQLQWLGGMGLIVLAVAILPSLSIGSIQLYRSEIPGPVKDNKLTPRIAETAKALWMIYVSLTIVCTLAYWFAGMGMFDAICHSFATVSIGGFSTHDESIGFFHSLPIDDIAVVFMLISGINFTLHYSSLSKKNIFYYLHDPECIGYIKYLLIGGVFTIIMLIISNLYTGWEAIQFGTFEFVSAATTTGFALTGFSNWPVILSHFFIIASFIGCCSGSAGGGIKVIRILIVLKQGYQELKSLVHPHAVYTLNLGGQTVCPKLKEKVWAYITIYFMIFLILYISLLCTHINASTAFSSLASCMNNLGPALGDASLNYTALPSSSKTILILSMLIGRLEMFTLLVLFTPVFWKN